MTLSPTQSRGPDRRRVAGLGVLAVLTLSAATACSSGSSSGGGGAPVFVVPPGLTVDEDSAGSFTITGVDASGGAPEVLVTTDPVDAFATLAISDVIDGAARVDFTPQPNLAGIVRIFVRVTTPGRSVEQMIRLALKPIPDDFIITPIADRTVVEGGSVTVPVTVQTLGGEDEVGQPFELAVRTLTGQGIPESIVVDSPSFTINTTMNGNGVATFEVEVSRGGFVRTETFALFITAVNDPPQFDDPDPRITIVENSPAMSFVFGVNPGGDMMEQNNQSVGFVAIGAVDSGALAELSASLQRSTSELTITLRPTPGFRGLTGVVVSLTDFLPGGQVDITVPVEVTPELMPATLGPGPTVELAPGESTMVTVPVVDRGDTAPTPPLSADSPSPTVQVSGLVQTLSNIRFLVSASAGDGPSEVVIPVLLGAPGLQGVSSVRVRRRPSAPSLANVTVELGGAAAGRGQVLLRADLVQDLGLPVDLLVELERSPGAGFRRVRPSVVSRDFGGEGLLARGASAAGRTWTFVFDSVEEFGLAQASGARFRVTPRLTDGGRSFAAPVGGSASGAPVTTATFDVDNRPRLTAGPGLPGNTPSRVLAADLDGDDAPELLALFPTELQVRAQTAPGSLSFGAPVSFALPASATALRAVPWGDSGRPALVLLLPSLDQLRIYRPDPSTVGAFLTPITRTVSGAVALDTGDFGGTGRHDLYVSDAGGITVFRQDPSLTEGLDTGDRTAVSDFGAFACGDLNGDGFDDVVVARPGLGQIHRLSRTPGGGPGFLAPALLFNGLADELRVQDMNGDGRVDIVRVEAASGAITVHRRANLQGFQFPVLTTASIGAAVADFAIGNIDHCAPLDLLVRRTDQSLVTARLSHSAAPIIEATGLSSALPVALGDLDSDRSVDLVATGPSGLRLLTVDRALAAPRRITAAFGPPEIRAQLFDVDGDGFEDALSLAPFRVSWRIGGSRFDEGELISGGSVFSASGDFDGDGRVDVIRQESFGFAFYRGSTTAPSGFLGRVLTEESELPPSLSNSLRILGVYHGLSGEPARVVVAANRLTTEPVFLLDLDSAGKLSVGMTLLEDGQTARALRLQTHDVDADGLPDLVFTNTDLVVLRRRAGPALAFEEPFRPTPGVGALNVAVADVDGDGLLDLLTDAGSSIQLFRQEPARRGTFQAPINFPVPDDLEHLAAADVTGDSRAEVFYATSDEVFVRVSSATASGVLEPAVSLVAGTPRPSFKTFRVLELQDVMGDPRPELVVAYRGGPASRVTILRPGPIGGALFEPALNFDGLIQVLRVTDMDGDGRLDLAGDVDQLLQTDTGFELTRAVALPFTAQTVNDLDAVDLNGDGRVELLFSGNGGLQLLRPEDNTPFGYGRPQTLLSANGLTAEAVVMDLFADGRLDVLFHENFDSFRLTPIGIDETLSATVGSSQTGSEARLRIMPLRRAGQTVPGFLLGSIPLNPVNTLPIFTTGPAGSIARDGGFTPGASVRETVVADLNRDGLEDIIFDTGQNTQIWLQQSSGMFSPAQTLTESRARIQVAKIDGDDLPDLVYLRNLPQDLLVVQLNQSGSPGTFGAPIVRGAPIPSGNEGTFTDMAVADLSGDGRGEVIALTGLVSGFAVYSSDAGPLDAVEQIELAFSGPTAVTVWDSDGDGLPEPVMVVQNGLYHLVRGPDGRFNRRLRIGSLGSLADLNVLTTGDVDGDGRDELIFATSERLIIIGGGRD